MFLFNYVKSLTENREKNMADSKLILLSCQDVGLQMGRKDILSSISFCIHQGERIALIGPNGAGKSSLCRLILGLLKPTSGNIKYHTSINFGYVPSYLTVNPLLPIDVISFMRLGAKGDDKEEIAFFLDQTDLWDKRHHSLHHLSSGERQRMLIAKALFKKPNLLILDEALSHVNFSGQQALVDLIDRQQEQLKFSSITVSHDMFLVLARTDNVICINRHISCIGKPMDISQHPEIVRLLGEDFARNLAYYGHHHHIKQEA